MQSSGISVDQVPRPPLSSTLKAMLGLSFARLHPMAPNRTYGWVMSVISAPLFTRAGTNHRAGSRRSGASVRSAAIHVVDDVESAFRHGSDDALRLAYDTHGSLIFTFCRRSLPDAAADLTQEVFLAAWRAREQFDPSRGPLQAWLIGIAKNKVIDAHRKTGRRVRTVNPPADGSVERLEPGTDPTETVERLANRMLLSEALDELPERGRKVIELAFFGDLTHTEISERTGLPLGTVKSDIRRGLNTLRTFVEAADV